MREIEIFFGPGCVHCEQAKALLKQHGLISSNATSMNLLLWANSESGYRDLKRYRRYLPMVNTSEVLKTCR